MTEKQAVDPSLMTFAALVEAVALTSDVATYLEHKPAATDEERDRNRAQATLHYARRTACMAELLRRIVAREGG